MDVKQLITFLKTLWTKTIAPSWKNISDSSTQAIVKAIQDKEYENINPDSISKPIVEALGEATRAIQTKKGVDAVRVLNMDEARADFSEVVAGLKALLDKKEKDVIVNTGDTQVNVDLKPFLKALDKIQASIPRYEKQEVIDYTLMFDEMMKIMERPGYSIELLQILDILKVISERPAAIPPELITKDGIKVVGLNTGKSLGRSVAYETVWQKNVAGNRVNPATEETLQAIAGLVPTAYDYISASFNDPAFTETYTYKTGGAVGTTVATLTVIYTDATKSKLASVAKT